MRANAARLGLVLMLLLPMAEQVEACPDETVEPALVTRLLQWIGVNSDYDTAPYVTDPPTVLFCSHGESIDYEGQAVTVQRHMKGLYDKDNNTIFLVRPWSGDDPYNRSTLLHELIHLVQYNSRDWPCWHKTEWEAYKLQEAWLNERGLESGFNWMDILILSRCSARDVHPSLE
ncbi:MAG: DUF6647 family protein [Candidatus Competibacterales bacterium]|nr:DUF6647 family protein [Candidatus Competibacterales bacterium]